MSLSSSATSSTTAPAAAPSSSSEERKGEPEMMHKIKVIQFLGRTTPIILQNDNGPCPLLAICMIDNFSLSFSFNYLFSCAFSCVIFNAFASRSSPRVCVNFLGVKLFLLFRNGMHVIKILRIRLTLREIN